MKCQSCGHRVERRAQFCSFCGAPVVARTTTHGETPAKPKWPFLLALVMAGIIVGGIGVNLVSNTQDTKSRADGFDPMLRGEALAAAYPEVYYVASQFTCPCGTCDDGLEVCDCQMPRGATEVRALIHELLQVHRPPHIIELIESQFGHRKGGASSPTFTIPDSSAIPWQGPK